MNNIIWHFPTPVTALVQGPRFEVLSKRQCRISFSIEGKDGGEKWLNLAFDDVEAYKCTYLASLGSIAQNLRTEAYGKLIVIKDSAWLAAINQSCQEYYKKMPINPKMLHHFMINFDDGPCFEIICREFKSPQ